MKNKADTLGIDTTKMEQLKNAVITYLTPLFVEINKTSNIVSDQLRKVFVDYYEKYNDIMTEIVKKSSEKAKEEAVKEVEEKIKAIKNLVEQQSDGKIETWYQPDDPSINWTTQEDMRKHKGDLWYNTTTERIQRYSGTLWQSIVSPTEDEVARNIARNKSKIFTDTPITPYKKGDFWVKNSELYISNQDRSNGIYNPTDWVLATKYTDDTKANQVDQRVSNGQITLNGNTVVNGDFKVRGQNVEINSQTSITGVLQVFSGLGLVVYNGNTDATSNKKVVITNGQIEIWERT